MPAGEADLSRLPDQLEYLELGRNLIAGNGLKFRDPDFDEDLLAYRAPGYPLLIAACGGHVRAVRVVQSLIETSTVLAVYVLARRWLGRGASHFAAALIAVNPFLMFFCGLILSETLFTSMLAWGMALLVWSRLAPWFGAIVLALSVLVRPSSIALPVLLAMVSAITNRDLPRPYLLKGPFSSAVSVLLLCGLVLLPWGYRNYHVLGAWIFTTTNSGMTFYDGFNPHATGASNQRSIRALQELRPMSETERSEYLSRRAWQYVREHPGRSAELAVVKIARTWSPVPLSEDYGSRRNVIIALGYMTPFYALIALGLWFGSPGLSAKVFLLLPAIYFTVAHALSVGSLRYRIPADVPMAIVAAAGVSRLGGFGCKVSGTAESES